jgi:hypothetical protein
VDDLVAFLAARLDEDEAAATAIHGDQWGWPRASPGFAAYVARHDPARALREVEAKRAILAETFPLIESEWGGSFGVSRWGEELLKYLALPYSDHPDYRAEWKPQ